MAQVLLCVYVHEELALLGAAKIIVDNDRHSYPSVCRMESVDAVLPIENQKGPIYFSKPERPLGARIFHLGGVLRR